MLSKITDNIEEKFDKETTNQQANKLDKLCITRWTVRAECLWKIKENYQGRQQLTRDSLDEKLDFETKLQIVGCKKTVRILITYEIHCNKKTCPQLKDRNSQNLQ